MSNSNIKFSYTFDDGLDVMPDNLELAVTFNGDMPLYKVVEAFKMFLKGCEYSSERVEAINYSENKVFYTEDENDLWNK